MSDNCNDGRSAPVPYRLPPSRKKARAGCWPVLLLALLGCGIAEGVRKFAEPIDRGGCKFDCERAGMEFASYHYETNTCRCLDVGKNEVKLYGLDLGQ